MADEKSFFSRWSKRKGEARAEERVLKKEAEPERSPSPQPSPQRGEGVTSPQAPAAVSPSPHWGEGRGEGQPANPDAPTLADAQSLTPDSDFRRFVAPEVDPQVKNAALKKLFADPHFNTMDGLDVYIDDYGKPDPLPAAMARKLASAQFLKLFADEEKNTPGGQGREVADDPAPQSVAQSDAAGPAVPTAPPDADPDLRLQQDHAPGPPGPGTDPA